MRAFDSSAIAAARLESAPIEASWIRGGAPRARCAELSRSRDGTAATFVWDCSAGEFDWTFAADETVHILEGEVEVDDGAGARVLRPGDVALFHAGATCRWRVPAYVKKLAFLRDPVPRPALFAMRLWRRLKRLARAPEPTLAPSHA
jgi:uncharacterized cupin superfamily protein